MHFMLVKLNYVGKQTSKSTIWENSLLIEIFTSSVNY